MFEIIADECVARLLNEPGRTSTSVGGRTSGAVDPRLGGAFRGGYDFDVKWFGGGRAKRPPREDFRTVSHFDGVDAFSSVLRSTDSAGMTVRDLLESARRFSRIRFHTLVDEPGADMLRVSGSRTSTLTKNGSVHGYYFRLSRKIKARTDLGPGWHEPGPYWHSITTILLYDAYDGIERPAEFSSTWYVDGDISFDQWIAILLEEPALAHFYDRPARLGQVSMASENPSAGVDAESWDGRWRFTGGVLHTETARATLPEVDWFEKWTYAQFHGSDQLVLALDTGQPMHSDGSSTGSRQGFVMVLQLDRDRGWELVAFEWGLESRDHDEDFVPDGLVWDRRGVLAWLYQGELQWHVRKPEQQPVTRDEPLYLNSLDSDFGLTAYSGELYNLGHTMTLDVTGRILSISDAAGIRLINVDENTQSVDGDDWEPIPEGLIFHHR
ncbi:hypothetical protein [Nocardia sp. NPDC006630]|uniref:hypothetical protein n=1 Tax=Nocardia sp. NPDC006630 TaxID=3157181 RepID=UPI0033B58851